ncbi:MAG: DUF1073 domain-containing protein [Snodgrassella sp.]|nr:DUF1073 domain-containing protein [Snodgrassella sp.]
MKLPKIKVQRRNDSKACRNDGMNYNPRVPYDSLKWQFTGDEQNYELLNNQYKHDAIARRVVAKPAEDATRNGWRLVIPDDPDKQDAYQDALDKLRLNDVLTQQLIYQRLHGDGYINFGVKEKNATDESKQLNPDDVVDVAFVHAFGQNHVDSYQVNNDPTSNNFKKEQAVVIRQTQAGSTINNNGNQVPELANTKPIIIDKSRYFHISLDKFEDDQTGTSIITRCQDQIKAMNTATESVGKILREFTIKVFKSDKVMGMDDIKYQEAVRNLSQAMNTESIAFIGSEDDLAKVSTPTNGMDTLFDFAWQSLSTACNIPKSVLTGEQAGSLAGASQDVVNYYDTIKSMQETLLKPEIEYIVKLLMYADNVAGGQENPDDLEWHIEFKPLWSPDDKTQSETLVNHVNAASTLVGSGIYDPDEARQILDGQGNNAIQGMQTSPKTDSIDKLTPEQIEQYLDDMKKATHGSKT